MLPTVVTVDTVLNYVAKTDEQSKIECYQKIKIFVVVRLVLFCIWLGRTMVITSQQQRTPLHFFLTQYHAIIFAL